MKIAIISDTHDNLANLKKAISFINKERIKILIHCGDIFKPETLREGLKGYQGKIYIIFSKADASFSEIPEDSFENLPRVKIYEEFGEIKINKRKIAFCHFPEIAKGLAKSQKHGLVFYGHTHKPWEETPHQSPEGEQVPYGAGKHGTGQEIGKTRLVNPGNLAGIFYKPTFAIYDTKTDKLQLKILEKL